MDTTLDTFRQRVESQVTKARWALGINGALAVAVGVLIIAWPNISLYSLVIVFGAFALARGIIGLGTAIGSPIREGRGWLVLSSWRASRSASSSSSGRTCRPLPCST